MAILSYNEIKEGKQIIYEGAPYTVIESHVARTQQRKPQNQTKIKNLLNGKLIAIAFHTNDSVEEAEISSKEIKYLYKTPKGEYWFCELDNPKNRFILGEDLLGNAIKFLKENVEIKAKVLDYNDKEEYIGLTLPVKMDFKIIECPPNIKGDTATGGNKVATIETGAKINIPLFINNGETIRINTDTGDYVERVRE
jgi:elongation factor P